MFIAMNEPPKDLAPLGAKPTAEGSPRQAKAIALLWSAGVRKKEPPGYKHLAPPGRKRQTNFSPN